MIGRGDAAAIQEFFVLMNVTISDVGNDDWFIGVDHTQGDKWANLPTSLSKTLWPLNTIINTVRW